MHRLLIGSPIQQHPAILNAFLTSLAQIKTEHLINYYFIDDNKEELSKQLLRNFQTTQQNTIIKTLGDTKDYKDHQWNDELIWKVANMKNHIFEYAIQHDYDYVFLVDSDILLHPDTIDHLLSLNKEIVSEIFWTRWEPTSREQPQVWMRNEYDQWHQKRGEHLSAEEKKRRYYEFESQMRTPGTYEVGGLGACTLISTSSLKKGLNFNEIPNITFWGEDRHFCIRAAALGIKMFVDTHYPAYHIFRLQDLDLNKAAELLGVPIPALPLI